MSNRQVVLKRHPNGIPVPEDFDLVEGSIAEPADGQMLVRNLFFSLEAAIRVGWMAKPTTSSRFRLVRRYSGAFGRPGG